MKLNITKTFIAGFLLISSTSFAQESHDGHDHHDGHEHHNHKVKSRHQKLITTSSGIETSNLQFTTASKNGVTLNTVPRFSYYFNGGTDFNVRLHKKLKPFTGIYLKNIGFITKSNGTTTKHRTYALGFPLGLKFFAMQKELQLKLGADFNWNFNYKEKTCVNDTKTKFNEWRSDRTPTWYPSLFAGVKYNSMSLTANYYYRNFFNKDFVTTGINDAPFKPYANTEVSMVTISFGYSLDKSFMKKNMKFKPRKHKKEAKSEL